MEESDKDLVLKGDIGSCLDLLWRKREAASVVVDFADHGLSEDDCLTLFRSLANYPSMVQLHVRDSKSPLPIKAFSALINDPGSRLRHLSLQGVTMTGKVGDYMILVESFRLCSLQSFYMNHCEFDNKNISLDPLVLGLATIATLEHVTIINTDLAPQGKEWTPHCLQLLLPQLQSLSLQEIPSLRQKQMCMLLSALEDPTCALKVLNLQQQNLSTESIIGIAQMLQKNTSLEELSLGVSCADNVAVIAKALEKRHQGLLSGGMGTARHRFWQRSCTGFVEHG